MALYGEIECNNHVTMFLVRILVTECANGALSKMAVKNEMSNELIWYM